MERPDREIHELRSGRTGSRHFDKNDNIVWDFDRLVPYIDHLEDVVTALECRLANAPKVIPASEVSDGDEVLAEDHWHPVTGHYEHPSGYVRICVGGKGEFVVDPDGLVCVRFHQKKSKVEIATEVMQAADGFDLPYRQLGELIVKALDGAES